MLAGQEGLEPPASGFGDRRSTNWSYWPVKSGYLFGLLVWCMLAAKTAVFPVLHTLGMLTLILRQIIIAAFAFAAGQDNTISGHLICSVLRLRLVIPLSLQ